MLHTFLADDVARAKVEEGARRAARSAEIARATAPNPEPKSGMRAALGRRMVRTGLRLSGADIATLATSATQADPCL